VLLMTIHTPIWSLTLPENEQRLTHKAISKLIKWRVRHEFRSSQDQRRAQVLLWCVLE
jgi:hypothetical protein